ncbi:ceramide synthase-like [Chiloscyllium plagiosum]|uniref:ceramide synthase-like n=1 Tax=Chiloscyllium plagiosum TaxID=36176 RepID=UPI001CB81481|nr:ceramide synthase-like [Chiloscyllium plagiosum]XP_043574278.1 ceramide synthase-like [Chiloscyllium plagiosum]XP_043574279.1 ceramide synthase-like [Chiloscyllium plagiosum]
MWYLLALGCLFFPSLFILTRRFLQKNFPSLTDVDTVNISVRFVSSVQAVMATFAGFIITSSCKHVMKDRHWISTNYVVFAAPYMAYDIYAMYLSHWFKHKAKHHNGLKSSSTNNVIDFLKKNFLMVLHHLALLLVCFPIIVYYRKGLGDFFLGCMFMAELSTPFVSFAKILKRFRKQNTLLYKVNGVILLVTFFLCRILVFPYMYWAYGKQYGIPAHLVPFHIPLHCTLGNAMLVAPQVYWLSLIIGKAGKTVKME